MSGQPMPQETAPHSDLIAAWLARTDRLHGFYRRFEKSGPGIVLSRSIGAICIGALT